MKKIIAGIIIAALIILGLTTVGLGKNQTASEMPTLSYEKTLAFQTISNTVTLDEQSTSDDPILSWYTIISLGLGVIGIATFRRNTFA